MGQDKENSQGNKTQVWKEGWTQIWHITCWHIKMLNCVGGNHFQYYFKEQRSR